MGEKKAKTDAPTMMVSASHLRVSCMKGSQMDSRAWYGSGMFSNRTSETPSILRKEGVRTRISKR